MPAEAIRQLELLATTDNETTRGLAREILLDGIDQRIKQILGDQAQEPAGEPQR